MKLRRRLHAADKTEHRAGKQAAVAAGGSAGPEPVPTWHEVAEVWRRLAPPSTACSKATRRKRKCASPSTKAAPVGRVYLTALNERKRDHASLAGRRH